MVDKELDDFLKQLLGRERKTGLEQVVEVRQNRALTHYGLAPR